METGPHEGIGLALRRSWVDQLRFSAHIWGHKMAAKGRPKVIQEIHFRWKHTQTENEEMEKDITCKWK